MMTVMARLLDRQRLRRQWEDALQEDGAERDLTSLAVAPERRIVTVELRARQAGVFAGVPMFDLLREAYPAQLTVAPDVADGRRIAAGDRLAVVTGPLRLLLAIERTLLNFLQRLCGVATLTRAYVDAVASTPARIYDTRKTVPGWRHLDKYAVRCGGGHNHRMGLHDAVLVKDNHLAGIEPARLTAAASAMMADIASLSPPPDFVEFEADDLQAFDALLKVPGIDVILLDNFSLADMREAVARRNAAGLAGRLQLEASGGVSIASVLAVAETGVDRIAVGAITHSAPALDIGIDAC